MPDPVGPMSGRIGRRARLQNALEMVVDRDRKRLLRDLLPDHVLIERSADVDRFWNADGRGLPPRIFIQFFIEDALTNVDAAVADVNARASD